MAGAFNCHGCPRVYYNSYVHVHALRVAIPTLGISDVT